ncbi:amidohydrolase [Rothia halotolerans]|uniref:amidohydrolase n=1 Tax=Rothia halotolerans TaxID=405770 RepID=UPI00101BFAE1|nr:amidohydrolase [Rothia halotolerans]
MTPQTPTLYHNARVFTGDAGAPLAESFAVLGDRVLAVGELPALRSAAGPAPEEVDLDGAFVAPGLVESHTHLMMLGESLDKVQLRDCESVAEVQDRLRAARRDQPHAERILGVSWRFEIFPDGQRPTAAMLDEAVPDVPVILDSNDLHSVWANTAALEAMGITRDTPDPVGGRILRDDDGAATGFLLETAAGKYAWSHLEEVTTDEDRDRFLENAFDAYLSAGITTATDMGLNAADVAAIRRRLERDGRLPFPVTGHWLLTASGEARADLEEVAEVIRLRDEVNRGPGAAWFRIAGVKFILDGVIDACTAAMRAPYVNGELPAPIWSRESALPVALAADAAGLQLAIHAIGDAASEIALDVVSECVRRHGPREDRRPRIEHLESVTEETIARMAALGVTASMQPVHCDPAILDNWRAALGPERGEAGFPWHRFRELGVPVALGTDAPTAPHEALANLFIAVTTESALDRSRPPYHPERAFSPAEALSAMTLGGARAGGLEAEAGRLASGCRAHAVVLSVDPLAGPPERMLEARALLTLVDGQAAYRRVEPVGG